MIGLTAEQTQLAWDKVIPTAGGRPVTARLAKSVLRELEFIASPKRARGGFAAE
jgi:hypothetical protein